MIFYNLLWLKGMIFLYLTLLGFGFLIYVLGQLIWSLVGKYKTRKRSDDCGYGK